MQSLRRKAKRSKKFADRTKEHKEDIDNITNPLIVGYTKSGRKVLYRATKDNR